MAKIEPHRSHGLVQPQPQKGKIKQSLTRKRSTNDIVISHPPIYDSTTKIFPIFSSQKFGPNLISLPLIFFLNFLPPSYFFILLKSSPPKTCFLLAQAWNLGRIHELFLLLVFLWWLGFLCFSLIWWYIMIIWFIIVGWTWKLLVWVE